MGWRGEGARESVRDGECGRWRDGGAADVAAGSKRLLQDELATVPKWQVGLLGAGALRGGSGWLGFVWRWRFAK